MNDASSRVCIWGGRGGRARPLCPTISLGHLLCDSGNAPGLPGNTTKGDLPRYALAVQYIAPVLLMLNHRVGRELKNTSKKWFA